MRFYSSFPNIIRHKCHFSALYFPVIPALLAALSLLYVAPVLVDAAHAAPWVAEDRMVTGSVVDASGEALPGATIAFRSPATGLVRYGAVSRPDGTFEVLVAPGRYEVEVRFVGFGALRRSLEVPAGEGVVRM